MKKDAGLFPYVGLVVLVFCLGLGGCLFERLKSISLGEVQTDSGSQSDTGQDSGGLSETGLPDETGQDTSTIQETASQLVDEDEDGFPEDSDCNDTDAAIHPSADEFCNEVDDNCDGAVDEDTAVDASTWYQDWDGDGYGDPDVTHVSCSAPSGFVADQSDCNDTNYSINLVAAEVCDYVDNNCDAQVDEGVATTYYADADGDGYGDAASLVEDCTQPSDYVTDSTDCNDTDPDWFWACTACQQELVTIIGFSQEQVWPGDATDVGAEVLLSGETAVDYTALRWDWTGSDWVTCGDVDWTGATPVANLTVPLESEYLGFAWEAGSTTYASYDELVEATVDGAVYSNRGDVGGNALLVP